jgi:hypothetical protein
MYKEDLPTVLANALHVLDLRSIPKTKKELYQAFRSKTENPTTLEQLTILTKARKLINKFLNYGTFRFNCANCRYLVSWDPSLYIEIDNVLLCPTCQKGLETILKNNPSFKRQADIDKEEAARIKAAELEAAYQERMRLRKEGLL